MVSSCSIYSVFPIDFFSACATCLKSSQSQQTDIATTPCCEKMTTVYFNLKAGSVCSHQYDCIQSVLMFKQLREEEKYMQLYTYRKRDKKRSALLQLQLTLMSQFTNRGSVKVDFF